MNKPLKEWNLPLTYRREGIFLYHLLHFMPPQAGVPYSKAKALNTFLKRAGGALLHELLNSSSKFRQAGFQFWL